MTEAECIDCGQWSEALLPARFPHICSLCLFPPRDENDNRSAEMGSRERSRSIDRDLIARLPNPVPGWTRMQG